MTHASRRMARCHWCALDLVNAASFRTALRSRAALRGNDSSDALAMLVSPLTRSRTLIAPVRVIEQTITSRSSRTATTPAASLSVSLLMTLRAFVDFLDELIHAWLCIASSVVLRVSDIFDGNYAKIVGTRWILYSRAAAARLPKQGLNLTFESTPARSDISNGNFGHL